MDLHAFSAACSAVDALSDAAFFGAAFAFLGAIVVADRVLTRRWSR